MPKASLLVRGSMAGGQGRLSDREARMGDGFFAYPNLVQNATAGAYTIPTTAVARGGYRRTGGAGDRVDTTPTGAEIDAAITDWDIGETRLMLVSNYGTTNKLTVTAGASGVTVSGHSAVLAATAVWIAITKTAAATYTWNCL